MKGNLINSNKCGSNTLQKCSHDSFHSKTTRSSSNYSEDLNDETSKSCSGRIVERSKSDRSLLKITPRIPSSLQKVFIESNQGREVHEVPEGNVASKVFEKSHHDKSSNFSKRLLLGSSHPRRNILTAASLLRTNSIRLGCMFSSPTKETNLKAISSPPSTCSAITQSSLKSKSKKLPTLSPQRYLDALLQSRGYSTTRYNALETGYHNQVTPLQVSSYGVALIEILRYGDHERMKTYLQCGLSPNPSNKFGESLVHMCCRLKDVEMFRTMVECGCDVKTSDSNGRTPLHDACWTHKPCFELIEVILRIDSDMLYITDYRNSLPLDYVPNECWAEWLHFLASKRDELWPMRKGPIMQPQLTQMAPNTRVAIDPTNAVTLKVAAMVSAGIIQPEEVNFLSSIDSDDLEIDDTRRNGALDEDQDNASTSTLSCDEDIGDEISITIDTHGVICVRRNTDTVENKTNPKDRPVIPKTKRAEISLFQHQQAECSSVSITCNDSSLNSFTERDLSDLLETFGSSRPSKVVPWSKPYVSARLTQNQQ